MRSVRPEKGVKGREKKSGFCPNEKAARSFCECSMVGPWTRSWPIQVNVKIPYKMYVIDLASHWWQKSSVYWLRRLKPICSLLRLDGQLSSHCGSVCCGYGWLLRKSWKQSDVWFLHNRQWHLVVLCRCRFRPVDTRAGQSENVTGYKGTLYVCESEERALVESLRSTSLPRGIESHSTLFDRSPQFFFLLTEWRGERICSICKIHSSVSSCKS